MTRFVLGVIGHVDHGKTALVRALTGIDTDRLPEEKACGISIALGFAHLKLADAEIDLIDMPGHEKFVRTMISGATGIDAVLLVVAANEGIRPQTIEHVDIAGLLGLRRALIAITKTDLANPAAAQAVADDAELLLTRAGLTPLPPIMTSATQGTGIADLADTLATLATDLRPHPADGLAFLPIDRVFTIAGHGPVVTGTLRGAAITAGDTLELLPSRRPVRVRAVQVHGAKVATALPGQRVALNLRHVEIADLDRGMALATPDAVALSDWLTISIRAVGGAPPLKNGKRLRVLLGTDEVDARLRLLDRDVLEPGQAGFAQLHLARPLAIPAGEPVILRLASPAQTVAGGRLLDPETRRLRRNAPAILSRLEALATLSPAALVAAEVGRASSTSLQRLSRLSALARPRIVELLRALPVIVTKAGAVLRTADIDRLHEQIPPLLARQPAGLAYDALLKALRATGPDLLDEALAGLLAARNIAKRGSQFVLFRPDEDRARARTAADLAARIAETLRTAGLTPPLPNMIVTDPPTAQAVDRLLRDGVIVRAVDRAKGKEMLFHRDAIAEARRILAPLLGEGEGLLVTEIAAALGISRKHCMPLLDHLDTIRFTRRAGDRRILGDKR